MNRRRPHRGRNRSTQAASEACEVEITKLGSEGVGVAYLDGKPILVPGALAGERVVAAVTSGSREAKLLQVISPSADRVDPACRHFGRCGGCSVQHLAPGAYAGFKHSLIVDALHRQGLAEIEVAAAAVSPAGSRRRASFEAVRQGATVTIGFHGRATHSVIDLRECPVLEAALVAILPSTRTLLSEFLRSGERASIVVTLLDHGVDIGLNLPRMPDLAGLETLSAFAEAGDLCRLWWRSGDAPPVPVAIRRPPTVTLGGQAVTVPMAGFLQATRAGEASMVAIVTAALAGASTIADLFAGIGTFSLPLIAAGKTVHAVEADAEAVATLGAAGRAGRLTGLTWERRDLDARPLLESEFARFDAVVFDPPRAGARAQAEVLARAPLDRIVAVSCNPATYVRDAAILLAGGWRHERLYAVDQFLWSSHVELVGVFGRAA